jgi:hypothetical protein
MTEPDASAPRQFARGPLVVGVLLVVLGAAWLLAALDVLEAAPGIWVGALLLTVAAALIAAPSGGHVVALIIVGILLALVGAAAAAIDADLLSGGIGDRTERPLSPDDIEDYDLGMGDLVVDLTALDEPATIEAHVGIGHLGVIVPDEARLNGEADAGLGNVRVRGVDHGGSDVHVALDEGGSGSTFTLHLEVGVGEVEIGGSEVRE